MAEGQSTNRPRRVKDITGLRCGRLVAETFHSVVSGNSYWAWLCDCGNRVITSASNAKKGDSQSCGCFREEGRKQRPLKHGHLAGRRRSPEYRCWHMMVVRCTNPRTRSYANYGARGITVCDRWRNSFEHFLADMGERPSLSHSLDRYPNRHGNYEPGNVRWATREEQQRNRDDNHIVEYDGLALCVAEWSEKTGLTTSTILYRLRRGWPVHEVLTKPPRRWGE